MTLKTSLLSAPRTENLRSKTVGANAPLTAGAALIESAFCNVRLQLLVLVTYLFSLQYSMLVICIKQTLVRKTIENIDITKQLVDYKLFTDIECPQFY